MRVTYDSTVDYAYIYLREIGAGEASRSEPLDVPDWGEIVLDFDKEGRLLGVEVGGAKSRLPRELLADAETR